MDLRAIKLEALLTNWKVIVKREVCRAWTRSVLVGMEETDLRRMNELKCAGFKEWLNGEDKEKWVRADPSLSDMAI